MLRNPRSTNTITTATKAHILAIDTNLASPSFPAKINARANPNVHCSSRLHGVVESKYYFRYIVVLVSHESLCSLFFVIWQTRRFAEAISNSLKIPVFDLTTSELSIVEKFDVLILGTPVHGFSPARRVSSFIGELPKPNGKKVIIFCTYAIYKGRTLKRLKNMLASKGYTTILSASKRGLKLSAQDFLDSINEIETVLKEQVRAFG